MKKADVKVGETYIARVSGNLVPVKIREAFPLGGWMGVNTKTGRDVRIRTAGRLRGKAAQAGNFIAPCTTCGKNVMLRADGSPTLAATMHRVLDGVLFCDLACSVCQKPRGTERWTLNGGKPAHVRCALEISVKQLEDAGLRPVSGDVAYQCCCSYPHGPHTLECLNRNPNANPPARV